MSDKQPSEKIVDGVSASIDITFDDIKKSQPLRCTTCHHEYNQHRENCCDGNDKTCECDGFSGYP